MVERTEAVHRYEGVSFGITLTADTVIRSLASIRAWQQSFPTRSVVIKADDGNTDTVMVGFEQDASFPLAGGEFVALDYIDLAKCFVALVTGSSGQKVYFIAGGL